ncbi:hypothetical protein ZHAS_00012338 [Anopheles sinensis]|uniref:Uncharacterized protein n=1 Tax=Anopheles sinensis TaxID=74873 RepID=A0A084W279_ANOSI|nr:hypothetical protein ZHAS_00012338 [Anopheles sinensis]
MAETKEKPERLEVGRMKNGENETLKDLSCKYRPGSFGFHPARHRFPPTPASQY